MEARPADLDAPDGVGEEALSQLAFRYGHAARKVLALAADRPELADPIVPGRPDLLAEVVIAARHEQARSVADVLLRRTRLGLLAAPQLRDAEAVRPLAGLLGEELGWSAAEVEAAAAAWPEEAVAEGIDPARAARAA
jgi:glycerol-3-phosphate dehydrogenase